MLAEISMSSGISTLETLVPKEETSHPLRLLADLIHTHFMVVSEYISKATVHSDIPGYLAWTQALTNFQY